MSSRLRLKYKDKVKLKGYKDYMPEKIQKGIAKKDIFIFLGRLKSGLCKVTNDGGNFYEIRISDINRLY